MKKIAIWLMSLAMLTACGGQRTTQTAPSAGMAGQETAASDKMEEITYKLLVDWYGYVIRCEYLYEDMQWVLSYLDPFFEDLSWDSLQIALGRDEPCDA